MADYWKSVWSCVFVFLLVIGNKSPISVAQIVYMNNMHYQSQQPLPSGEHISMDFYSAMEKAQEAKARQQGLLQNFLEILQRNLTTSTILNTMNTIDVDNSRRQLQKLADLANFFQTASEHAAKYAIDAEHFFEASKNESENLLQKLRKVPIGPRALPMPVKLHLTDYFAEMEFFHVMFTEIVDEALEYIIDTLQFTQRVFLRYADIQRDVLYNWNFKPDAWCCNRYMDFLQQWSAQIFKCAAGHELNVAYDVYASAELTIKYILRQQEFRIQRLFNCFLLGNYEIRCRFLRNAESDFEKLFAKLDELQIYCDILTKQGRITTYRSPHARRAVPLSDTPATAAESKADPITVDKTNKCIPYGFPDSQMPSNLKACFYFPYFN